MRNLIVGLVVLAASTAHAQWDDVQIEATSITDNVHMLKGRGGNLAVCTGTDGAFLVDDQFAPLTEKIVAAVAELGGDEIRFVINTHWHGDHTGGNEKLGAAGTVVVAHDNVRERMSTDQFSEFWDRATPAANPGALPVVTFPTEVRFHLNGETIHAFHVAHAHTDGDAIIHFENANVIHMGDVWFNGMYPFIDADSGGSLDGVIAAVQDVLALANDETRIIPGHGGLGDKTALGGYLEMLTQVREKITAAVREHGDLESVVAADPLADLNETWGGGFIDPERMVRMIAGPMLR